MQLSNTPCDIKARSMSMSETQDAGARSLFADLAVAHASAGPTTPNGDASAPWLVLRAQSGFGDFERQINRARRAEGAGEPLGEDASRLMVDWLAHRHPQRSGMQRDYLVAVSDTSRIWSSKLFEHVEQIGSRRRSRVNLIRTDSGGGAFTVSHLTLGEAGQTSIHLYSAELRERGPEAAAAVQALHSQCDLLVEVIGPITRASVQHTLSRLRATLADPDQPLQSCLLLVSPTATAIHGEIEAFVAEFSASRVHALQIGLTDTAAQWAHVLERLEIVATAVAASGQTAADYSCELADVLQAMAQTEGTHWVALVGRDPSVHMLQAADTPSHDAHGAALSMAVLVAGETRRGGDVIRLETEDTLTLARVLVEPQLALAVRFDKSQVSAPVAELLLARMCEDLEALHAGATTGSAA
jgi:hypothetical protein